MMGKIAERLLIEILKTTRKHFPCATNLPSIVADKDERELALAIEKYILNCKPKNKIHHEVCFVNVVEECSCGADERNKALKAWQTNLEEGN